MKRLAATTVVLAMTLVPILGTAWAQATVTMTREASKPQKLEIKGGEEVRWVNATGGTAHVMFAGAEGINFYIGKEGRVKFDKPGTPSTSRESRRTLTRALWW
jgi:plastocyanin